MKWLVVLFTFVTATASAQVLTQTFIDPCSGQVTVVTVPIANGKTTIVYRGKFRQVTANDITSGELQAWINNLTVNFPCPQAQVAVTQTVAKAVQQAVAQATSSATSQATSQAASSAVAASMPPPPVAPPPVAPPPAPSSTQPPASTPAPKTESKTEVKTESKSESKTESKSEEKSESKTESKSEEKKEESKSSGKSEKKSSSKSQAKVNPIVYSSDFTVAPTADVLQIIASFGFSQSSLMGNSSWGISSMVWSSLDQFALSGRYTKMNFNAGKLESISNYGLTGVYLGGSILGFGTAAYIYPMGKYGVSGANYTFSVAGADAGLNLSNNILLFYTIPIPINKRLTISPDLYVSGSSTGYLTSQKLFVTTDDVAFLTGASFDIAFTKRFKLNFAIKTGFSTNAEVAQNYLGMIGTKINL
jgi:hypothetical protein